MFYIQDCTRPQFHPSLFFCRPRAQSPLRYQTPQPYTPNEASVYLDELCSLPYSLVHTHPPTRLPTASLATTTATTTTTTATHRVPSFPFVPLRRRSFFFSPANARFATVHRARLSILVRAFSPLSPSPPPETERKRNVPDRFKCL